MRILVCGNRNFNDISLLSEVLSEVHSRGGHPYDQEITDLIHGCARGADSLAGYWAQTTYTHSGDFIKEHRYPADWDKYGKGAGYIRNKQMLVEGNPDKVIAFLAPNSKGTANMIKQAQEAGVPVEIINV